MLTHTGFPLGIVCSPLEGCCGGNGGNIFCLLNHQAALLPRGQRAALTELVCFNKLLFSNDFEGNLDSDLFVEVKFGVVFADFLDGVFDFDDLDTFFFTCSTSSSSTIGAFGISVFNPLPSPIFFPDIIFYLHFQSLLLQVDYSFLLLKIEEHIH